MIFPGISVDRYAPIVDSVKKSRTTSLTLSCSVLSASETSRTLAGQGWLLSVRVADPAWSIKKGGAEIGPFNDGSPLFERSITTR
jgi:hypothetical protein